MGVTTRIYQIHQLLKSKNPVSLKRMMAQFEVSESSIKRDLALLRDQLGAPLKYDREKNGYLYDSHAEEFELPGLWFNESELYALLAIEQLLELVQPGLLAHHIEPLKNRIQKLLQHGGHSKETITSRIQLHPIASRTLDNRIFGQAADATLNGTPLHITYHSRGANTESQRTIHPYRLIHYRDNWYLAAWCDNAKAIRTFSLDRIRTMNIMENRFHPADENDLQQHLNASFGIFTGEAKEWAVLSFSAHRANWIADEQWHPEQIGHWKGERYELHIPYSNPTELVMEILKYGPEVEVLAPATLREQVRESLQKALKQYKL